LGWQSWIDHWFTAAIVSAPCDWLWKWRCRCDLNGWIISGLFSSSTCFSLALAVSESYTASAWTLTYLRLTAKPATQMIAPSDIPGDIIPPPA
jgi:hypothetical protein